MWNRIKELNKEFKDIKEHKKRQKMSKTILKVETIFCRVIVIVKFTDVRDIC